MNTTIERLARVLLLLPFCVYADSYSWSQTQSSGMGEAVYQVLNPNNSGVAVVVTQVICTSLDSDSYWSVRVWNKTLRKRGLGCNEVIGGGGHNSLLRFDKIRSSIGSRHDQQFVKAGEQAKFTGHIVLNPGRGIILRQHLLNKQISSKSICSFRFLEVAN